MSTAHPWRLINVNDTNKVVGSSGHVVCNDETYYPTPVDKDDMVLMVRAVNAHDELVTCLTDIMGFYEKLGITQPWFARAQAALDKLK